MIWAYIFGYYIVGLAVLWWYVRSDYRHGGFGNLSDSGILFIWLSLSWVWPIALLIRIYDKLPSFSERIVRVVFGRRS